MEKLDYKVRNINKMLILLESALNKLNYHSDPDDIEFVRDSVAARFKILVESTWKAIKIYLETKGLAMPGSPRDVLQEAVTSGFLSQNEFQEMLNFINLRNLASHLYDEPQYLLVIKAAPDAFKLISIIMQRINFKPNQLK